MRQIIRKTSRPYSAEEKIRVVLNDLRGQYRVAKLCCREGNSQGIYYKRLPNSGIITSSNKISDKTINGFLVVSIFLVLVIFKLSDLNRPI